MESVAEQTVISEIFIHDEKKYPRKPSLIPIPTDRFNIGYIFFFFMGVCHFMPIVFFATVNNFWMYRFRNVEFDNVTIISDATNRTVLQRYFASASQVSNTAPALLFSFFNILVAYKYAITSRVSITLAIQTLTFVLFTVSVEINTDDYQVLYFALVMMGNIFITSAAVVNMVSSMSLYSRFPYEYMTCCLIGEGVASVAGDLINIMCIAVFEGDIIKSTLVYFIFGSAVLLITFLLSIFAIRTDFFQHCLHLIPQEKSKLPSKKEVLHVLYKIRYVVYITTYYIIGMAVTHTAITSLVVSEQSDTPWAVSYFSPVMTFFLSDFATLIGRLISSFIPLKMSDNVLHIVTIIRTVVFIPLVWLCNAQPKYHLPVVFGHDWQYGVIMGVFMVTNGYLLNYLAVISEKVDKKEADVAYTLYGFIFNVLLTITSPIGLFIVNIL